MAAAAVTSCCAAGVLDGYAWVGFVDGWCCRDQKGICIGDLHFIIHVARHGVVCMVVGGCCNTNGVVVGFVIGQPGHNSEAAWFGLGVLVLGTVVRQVLSVKSNGSV